MQYRRSEYADLLIVCRKCDLSLSRTVGSTSGKSVEFCVFISVVSRLFGVLFGCPLVDFWSIQFGEPRVFVQARWGRAVRVFKALLPLSVFIEH